MELIHIEPHKVKHSLSVRAEDEHRNFLDSVKSEWEQELTGDNDG